MWFVRVHREAVCLGTIWQPNDARSRQSLLTSFHNMDVKSVENLPGHIPRHPPPPTLFIDSSSLAYLLSARLSVGFIGFWCVFVYACTGYEEAEWCCKALSGSGPGRTKA